MIFKPKVNLKDSSQQHKGIHTVHSSLLKRKLKRHNSFPLIKPASSQMNCVRYEVACNIERRGSYPSAEGSVSVILALPSGCSYNSVNYYFTPCEFFKPVLTGSFSLKFAFDQVFRTLLSILHDLKSSVVWMANILLLLVSCSYIPFTRPVSSRFSFWFLIPLVSFPSPCALTIIGITTAFVLNSFFNNLEKSKYLSIFLFSFIFTQ